MKTIIYLIIFALLAALPQTFAADGATTKAEEVKTGADKKEETGKQKEEKNETNIFTCSYYTVHLPPDWRAVLPPEEREGLVNAIFARNTNSTVITMIIGPRAGADAKMIATMFAEQFKAAKPPVEKNGQYVFSFTQKDALEQKMLNSTSYVNVYGDEFMITTCSGNQKEAQNFLKNNVESEKYAHLLPQ